MMRFAGFPVLALLFVLTAGYSQSKSEMATRNLEVIASDPLIEALGMQETDSFPTGKEILLSGLSPALFIGEKMTGVYLDLGLSEDDLSDDDQVKEEYEIKLNLFHQVCHFDGGKSLVELNEPFFSKTCYTPL